MIVPNQDYLDALQLATRGELPDVSAWLEDVLSTEAGVDWPALFWDGNDAMGTDEGDRQILRWPLYLLAGDVAALLGQFQTAERRYAESAQSAVDYLNEPDAPWHAVYGLYQLGCELRWRSLPNRDQGVSEVGLHVSKSITTDLMLELAHAEFPDHSRRDLCHLARRCFGAVEDAAEEEDIWLLGLHGLLFTWRGDEWQEILNLNGYFLEQWRWGGRGSSYADEDLSREVAYDFAWVSSEAAENLHAQELAARARINDSQRAAATQSLQRQLSDAWQQLPDEIQHVLETGEAIYQGVDKGLAGWDWASAGGEYWKGTEVMFRDYYLPEIRKSLPKIAQSLEIGGLMDRGDGRERRRTIKDVIDFILDVLPRTSESSRAEGYYLKDVARRLSSWPQPRGQWVHRRPQSWEECCKLRRDVVGGEGTTGVMALMARALSPPNASM